MELTLALLLLGGIGYMWIIDRCLVLYLKTSQKTCPPRK